MQQTIQQIKAAEQQREEARRLRQLLDAMCRQFEKEHVLWPTGVQEWWRANHTEGHA